MLDARINGEKGHFDCPIKLFVYGPSTPAVRAELEAKLKADKLLKATELKKTRMEAESLRASMGLKGDRASAESGADQGQDVMDELLMASQAVNFRMSGDAIKTLAMDEDQLSKMPKACQPDAVKSQLLPYQLQVNISRVPLPA